MTAIEITISRPASSFTQLPEPKLDDLEGVLGKNGCPICFEEMDPKSTDPTTKPITLRCNHIFHEYCLDVSKKGDKLYKLGYACPVCRQIYSIRETSCFFYRIWFSVFGSCISFENTHRD
jgi:hypothetical protein